MAAVLLAQPGTLRRGRFQQGSQLKKNSWRGGGDAAQLSAWGYAPGCDQRIPLQTTGLRRIWPYRAGASCEVVARTHYGA